MVKLCVGADAQVVSIAVECLGNAGKCDGGHSRKVYAAATFELWIKERCRTQSAGFHAF